MLYILFVYEWTKHPAWYFNTVFNLISKLTIISGHQKSESQVLRIWVKLQVKHVEQKYVTQDGHTHVSDVRLT